MPRSILIVDDDPRIRSSLARVLGKGSVVVEVADSAESALGYANSTVVGLLDEAAATLNPDEVDRIYRQLMPVFQEDIPISSLYPDVSARPSLTAASVG